MIKIGGISMAVLVLVASIAGSDTTSDVHIQGKIGDCAPQSRIYEIDGTVYPLTEEIIIADTYGNRLDFRALQPGVAVHLSGRTTQVENEVRIIFQEAIVLKLQEN